MESNHVMDRLGALDAPLEGNPIPSLMEKRGKVIGAARWSIYDCTNKLRDWNKNAKELREKIEKQEE
jgi:hypothetical protein